MTEQLLIDRARGSLVGLAVADALGQFYEAAPPIDPEVAVEMKSRLQFEVGEWTDDTCMAIAVALGARDGDLLDNSGLELVATHFYDWMKVPKGIGGQVADVLIWAPQRNADGLLYQAAKMHTAAPNRAGNGSLMRTAPIGLAYLGNQEKIEAASRRVSMLTHFNIDCQEACVIWSKAVSHAVEFGSPEGIRAAIDDLNPERAEYWHRILDEAQREEPGYFQQNGWVVQALQVAWSSLYRTNLSSPGAYLSAIEKCIRAGGDTDTTAAICGSLAGALVGESNIPLSLANQIHGWPGYTAKDLSGLAEALIHRSSGW